MRKIGIVAMVSIIFLGSGLHSLLIRNHGIRIEIDFPSPTITEVREYHRVTIKGMPSLGQPGEPVLPVKTIKILIPFGQEVKRIKVSSKKERILKGKYLVEPGQRPVPLRYRGKVPLPFLKDKIYSSNHPFPGRLYSNKSIQSMRGYKILLLNLHPVKYIPGKRELSYYESIKIEVTTISASKPTLFRGKPEDRERIKKMVENPQAIATYPVKEK